MLPERIPTSIFLGSVQKNRESMGRFIVSKTGLPLEMDNFLCRSRKLWPFWTAAVLLVVMAYASTHWSINSNAVNSNENSREVYVEESMPTIIPRFRNYMSSLRVYDSDFFQAIH